MGLPRAANFSRLLAGFVTTTPLDFMSDLTYIVCGDEPTRETPGLVARRDQDAAVHGRGPGGSGPPLAAYAALVESGCAPLGMECHHQIHDSHATGQTWAERLEPVAGGQDGGRRSLCLHRASHSLPACHGHDSEGVGPGYRSQD